MYLVILRNGCSIIDFTLYRKVAMKKVFIVNYVAHIILAYMQTIVKNVLSSYST